MDITPAIAAVSPPTGISSSSFSAAPQEGPPVAPPELVGKFEALMARVDGPTGATSGAPGLSAAAVNKVEEQLALHNQVLDNVLAVGEGKMSLIDLQALQIRNVTQAGILSMTHTAYTQVLRAG